MSLKIIMGESHTMHSYRYMKKVIGHLCKINALDILLQENAFNYRLDTARAIEDKIKRDDHMVSNLHYELGLTYDLPIHGIDIGPLDRRHKINLVDSFMYRENTMVSVANKTGSKYNYLLTVGDTHLRSIKTNELGRASPLYTGFVNKPDCFIIRADHREIDVGDEIPSDVYTYDGFYKLILSDDFINKYSRDSRLLSLQR